MNLQYWLYLWAITGPFVGMWLMAVIAAQRCNDYLSNERATNDQAVTEAVERTRRELAVKYEAIGFEKGHEAGKAEAQNEFRDKFILFFEEQLRILKNPQLPAHDEDIVYVENDDEDLIAFKA